MERLHVAKNSATGSSIYVTNDSTGHTSSDGLQIGYDGSNDAEIRNRENTNIKVYTNNTEKLRVTTEGIEVTGNVNVGTGTATTDSDHTVDAAVNGMFSITASFTTTRSVNVSNLTDGRKVIIHIRNTNGSARTINILASTTTSGHAAVNMMPSSPGGPSVTAGQIGATSGTLFITVANINGTFCGHFG